MVEGFSENFKCPHCGKDLIWTHMGAAGTRSTVVCAGNIRSSRIILKKKDFKICKWECYIIKNKNGKFQFLRKDNKLYPTKKYFNNSV
jgi:hypothetical protein